MEQEHMIIIALLVVALYFLMMRKPCACATEGFENVGTPQDPIIGAAWLRKRRQDDQEGSLGLVNAKTALRIRNRVDEQGFGLQHVRNRNHNMYHSQYVRHHLKADHRGKMMNSMMRGGPDCAGGECN